jgi:RNA polymerase sigma-70 factor (ECF subfamily)
MEELQQPEALQSESSPATLGDVVYANKKPRPSEADWVALVRAVAAGDQRSLHALYERSHRLVFTLSMRITSNRETAEEVMLDVFHDLWRRAAAYDPANGTVLGWIMNQARSRAIDRVRFEQRKKRVEPMQCPAHASGEVDQPDLLEVRERDQALREAMSALTPLERRAIEMAFFSELTYAEAAARLNEPLGTVKTRIRSGLQKLRGVLSGARDPR